MTITHLTTCNHHLPANLACPHQALYIVHWRHHRIGDALAMQRPVCMGHLPQAINDALADSSIADATEGVRVCLVGFPPPSLTASKQP